MDKSINPIEESRCNGVSSASGKDSLGPISQINSITIDLGDVMETVELPKKHEHFSIRGFVAEMRKKDRKKCLPFASEGDGDESGMNNLPPLDVPSFRWWQCSGCIPDISSERSTVDIAVAGRADASTSSCQNDREKDSSSVQENQLKKHLPRNYGDGEDSDPVNAITRPRTRFTEGQKSTKSSKNRTGKSPLKITETNSCAADAFEALPIAEGPSCSVDDPSSSHDGNLKLRKKPKLRFLADIIGEERNPGGENPTLKSASSSGTQCKSNGTEAALGPPVQLDVPVDAGKSIKTSQTKRKVSPEEDREPSSTIGVAKRVRGLTLEADRTCRRVESAVLESERDASTDLDFQLHTKIERTKTRKSKALYVSKNVRHARIDNKTVPMEELPKTNSPCAVNSEKHALSRDTNLGNGGNVSSTVGEMGPSFRSPPPGLQMESISTLTKSKRPEVEANHISLMAPSKSTSGDCSTKGKVALDLSLNSFMDCEKNSSDQPPFRPNRGIPDLNETFGYKTVMMRGKQLATISENKSLSQHEDISSSYGKEPAVEGRRQLVFSKQQGIQQKNNITEHRGGLEDIPMEIVELLAKNKLERERGSSRKQLLPEGDSNRGSRAPYEDGRLGFVSFPPVTGRGVTLGNGHGGVVQDIPGIFSQRKESRLDMGKPDESQFRIYGSYTPSQQRKMQYSASGSMYTGPRHNGGTELLWPPRRENVPFHVSFPQNHNLHMQASSMDVPSLLDQCRKGKTISDIKSLEEKGSVHNPCLLKEHNVGSNTAPGGSLDPYSNDSIPAMQLLSLMDHGIVTGRSSFKMGSKSFPDKPFAPCNHHPQLNGTENQNFLKGSFSSQNSHSKGFLWSRFGASSSGEKKASSHSPGQIALEQGTSQGIHVERRENIVVRPAQTSSRSDVCTLNRNPADFTILDAKNEYTISAKDLKPKKKRIFKSRARSLNVGDQKRQRVVKDVSGE